MSLSISERRDLIALLCRVARADGAVTDEEHKRLLSVLERVGGDTVSPEQLASWLENGPPWVQSTLSPAARQTFMNEAMGVVAADRHIDPSELHAVREILKNCFDKLDELLATG